MCYWTRSINYNDITWSWAQIGDNEQQYVHPPCTSLSPLLSNITGILGSTLDVWLFIIYPKITHCRTCRVNPRHTHVFYHHESPSMDFLWTSFGDMMEWCYLIGHTYIMMWLACNFLLCPACYIPIIYLAKMNPLYIFLPQIYSSISQISFG